MSPLLNRLALPIDTGHYPKDGPVLGLLAGEGELPVRVAQNAIEKGYRVVVLTMDRPNLSHYRKIIPADCIHFVRPGLAEQNIGLMHRHRMKEVVFVGKFNKWMLLQFPVLDNRAKQLWRNQRAFNDDSIMLTLIRELAKEGITVLPQTDFMQDLFIPPGVYTHRQPTEVENRDIQFGLNLAKEMGRLDVGQTVVVSNGMILAVEAIEGTDRAIQRAGKWAGKHGGVVVKVEKPGQDTRFDVPTVGPRTLKRIKEAQLNVLAVEAGKTLVLEREKMIDLANRWQITFTAV